MFHDACDIDAHHSPRVKKRFKSFRGAIHSRRECRAEGSIDPSANSACFTNREAMLLYSSASKRVSDPRRTLSSSTGCYRHCLSTRPSRVSSASSWGRGADLERATWRAVPGLWPSKTPPQPPAATIRVNCFPCDAGATAVSVPVHGTRRMDCHSAHYFKHLDRVRHPWSRLTVSSCRSCML